jgi:hypothetical protein
MDMGTTPRFTIKIIGTPPLCGGCETAYDVGCSAEWSWPTLGSGPIRRDLNRVGGAGTATQSWESEFAFDEAGTWEWWVTCSDRNGTASTKRMDEGTVFVVEPPESTQEP